MKSLLILILLISTATAQEVKIIKVKDIPFTTVKEMALYPIIFTTSDTISMSTLNHELIHIEQYRECRVVPLLVFYGIEFLVKKIKHKKNSKAYKAISFEREAYAHENDLNYLNKRKQFAWFKYIFKHNKILKRETERIYKKGSSRAGYNTQPSFNPHD